MNQVLKRKISATEDIKESIIDFQGKKISPLKALDKTFNKPVLIDVKSSQCGLFRLTPFPMTPESLHPFVLTVNQLQNNKTLKYEDSFLRLYYETVQPENAATFLGFKNQDNPKLANLDALEACEPWYNICGQHIKNKRLAIIKNESLRFSDNPDSLIGWKQVGPVSNEMGAHILKRLKQVVESIKTLGYLPGPDYGFMNVIVLCDKNRTTEKYRFIIRGGQHRAAVLAAFGYKKFPVIIYPERVIKREKVFDWPGVKSGQFTKKQSLEFFDRIFDLRLPKYMEEIWTNNLILKNNHP